MSDLDPTTGRRTATDKRAHFRMAVGSFTDPVKFAAIVADPIERMVTVGLHAACVDRSRAQGSDGHIVLEELCDSLGLPYEYGKNLITAGACHQAEHGCRRCPQPREGHVYVHDYLEHNRSAAQEEQILRRRRAAGAANAAVRWPGKPAVPPVQGPKRPPGRPRKNAAPAAATAFLAPLQEPVPARETEQVLVHPAEQKARKQGRPRRTAPRQWDQVVTDLCDRLADRIAENDPDHKRPEYGERWLNACRLMIEKDKRAPESIARAIDWCQNHEFWRANILSMPTLREKYVTIGLQARRVTPARRGGPPAAINYDGVQDGWAYEAQQRSGRP